MTQPVFRFAPSPNGRLHLGHAYSALLNAELARRSQGRFLLRIEDIDPVRSKPEFEAAILDDLAWLGLAWERPVRRQSEHLAEYAAALRGLRGRGLVYPCFCSRGDIRAAVGTLESRSGPAWPRDPDGALLYPGTCRALPGAESARRIAAGEVHAWRLDAAAAWEVVRGPFAFAAVALDGREEARAADPSRWGDAVLARKDVPTSYHLCVVLDDAVQGVTHVVRGRDLEAATDLHVGLQRLLGLATPRYHHHALILDPVGDKLAKSAGSESLADLRARGVRPEEIRRLLGFEPRGPASPGPLR